MNDTFYRKAMALMWKGMALFMRSWAVTMNMLLLDVVLGIRRHWFFAIVLTAAFAAMFVVMAESRAMYQHGEMINYMLTQQLDSLKLVKGY